jgi:hypothetical protein
VGERVFFGTIVEMDFSFYVERISTTTLARVRYVAIAAPYSERNDRHG